MPSGQHQKDFQDERNQLCLPEEVEDVKTLQLVLLLEFLTCSVGLHPVPKDTTNIG